MRFKVIKNIDYIEFIKNLITMTQKYLDDLTYEIIGSAIEVHKIMGRGLLENAYHLSLIHI